MQIKLMHQLPAIPRNGDPSLVCQREWGFLVPYLHRILANPSAPHVFPDVPRTGHPLDGVAGYWEALHYLCRSLLGWTNPGRGLLWWYEANQPTTDLRLNVMKTLWGSEDQIDLYAAWCWAKQKYLEPSVTEMKQGLDLPGQIGPGERWWAAFNARFSRDRRPYESDPFHGGSNALHLGHSDWALHEHEPSKCFLLHSDPNDRRATIVVDTAADWRPALYTLGRELPHIGDRSWHVDVVAKPIGWLGSFRRSRITGLWFLGKHSLHMRGN